MPPKFSRETANQIIYSGETVDYQMRTSPCEISCPAGNPIQKTLTLMEKGLFEEALAALRTVNPFPGITGRICKHPCKKACNRSQFDKAVSIKGLELAATKYGGEIRQPVKNCATEKQVGIIGAGPAGLTCAYFLVLMGHSVTLFEALPVLGGIPGNIFTEDRLPKKEVDEEIRHIIDLGVQVRTNTQVGKDILFEEITREYDATLIAVGTGKPITSNNSIVNTASPWIKPLIHEKNLDFLKKVEGVQWKQDSIVDVDNSMLITEKEGLFAAGDIMTGVSSVAHAIGNGRRAAISIDAYLQGESISNIRSVYIDSKGNIVKDRYTSYKKQDKLHVVSFSELRNLEYFKQIELNSQTKSSGSINEPSKQKKPHLDREQARKEASLCFHCGHCFSCGICADVCPGDIIEMVDNQPQLAYPDECIHCGACMIDCPASAIQFHLPLPMTLSIG